MFKYSLEELGKRKPKSPLPPINKILNREFISEVDKILTASKNLIERSLQPPVSTIPGYSSFLLVAAHATRNTFSTIRYLVG